ncbi:MAG: hypothetical protein ACK47B_10100 [Armatimonadota bacterium]
MATNREQIAAELVWRYVEQIRECHPDGPPPRLSRDELRELVEMLDMAAQVQDALPPAQTTAEDPCRAAVRRRVLQALETGGAARPPAPSRRPWRAPRWASGAAFALAGVCLLALASVNVWHRPAPEVVVRRVKIPADAPDIEPMDEQQVHDLVPRMVGTGLDRRKERSLMWHMLVCPGCYDYYVEVRRRSGQTAEGPSPVFTAYR